MNQAIKIKVRPGGALQFPALCVHCAERSSDTLMLRKRNGRITRMIEVPLCSECHREVGRQSAEEERLTKLGRLVPVMLWLLVFVILILVIPSNIPTLWQILASTVGALAAAIALYFWFDRKRQQAALPKKKAILSSAVMADFSWRTTTFEFINQEFKDQFIEINEARLM